MKAHHLSKGKDKRKFPRAPARNVLAHVNVADKSTPCTIQNISAGGMFIESVETMPVGMPVAVNLAQPGWTKVLRLAGRVVWAMAPRTASKKGTVPGMRIRFDALDPDSAEMLLELLHGLGIADTPPPELTGAKAGAAPPGAPAMSSLSDTKTQEVSLTDIVARISRTDVPAASRPLPPATAATPGERASGARERASAPRERPSALHAASAADDTTLPARGGSLPEAVGATASSPQDASRLVVQVKGLLMQLQDLQQTLEARERELAEARLALHQKELVLEKSERERRAAEMAIQRLSMQIAARR